MEEKGGNKREDEKKSTGIVRGTCILLHFMFYTGILVILSLPVSLRLIGRYYDRFLQFYIQSVLLYFTAGVLALLILRQLRKMMVSVVLDDCFVEANVISLKKMGGYSFAIMLVCLFRMFLYITPSILVVFLVFLIAGLFSRVLSLVFEKAVAYKLENDLTI